VGTHRYVEQHRLQAQAQAGTDRHRQAQTGQAPAGSEAGAVAGEWQGETFGLVRSFRLSCLGLVSPSPFPCWAWLAWAPAHSL
jgi:hypothetical protein